MHLHTSVFKVNVRFYNNAAQHGNASIRTPNPTQQAGGSCKRFYAGGVMQEGTCRRGHAGGIMQEGSCRRVMQEGSCSQGHAEGVMQEGYAGGACRKGHAGGIMQERSYRRVIQEGHAAGGVMQPGGHSPGAVMQEGPCRGVLQLRGVMQHTYLPHRHPTSFEELCSSWSCCCGESGCHSHHRNRCCLVVCTCTGAPAGAPPLHQAPEACRPLLGVSWAVNKFSVTRVALTMQALRADSSLHRSQANAGSQA